jgi:hypothetical protein
MIVIFQINIWSVVAALRARRGNFRSYCGRGKMRAPHYFFECDAPPPFSQFQQLHCYPTRHINEARIRSVLSHSTTDTISFLCSHHKVSSLLVLTNHFHFSDRLIVSNGNPYDFHSELKKDRSR